MCRILNDFIILAENQRPSWYPKNLAVEREIGKKLN